MFEGSRLLIFLFAVMTVTLTLSSTATSRDVAKIVFVSDRDGKYEQYIMSRDGSGQTRLTNSPEAEGFPAGSPDGRTIAYLRQNSTGDTVRTTTSSFGNYSFEEILTGGPYTITVSSKRYRFSTRTVFLENSLTNVDLIGLE